MNGATTSRRDLIVFVLISSIFTPQSARSEEATAFGRLTLTTTEAAVRVSIDGEYVGDTPINEHQISEGNHELSLEMDLPDGSQRRFTYRLVIDEGVETVASLNLSESGPAPDEVPLLAPSNLEAEPPPLAVETEVVPQVADSEEVSMTGRANGGPQRSIEIETTPPGALVWREGEEEPSETPVRLRMGSRPEVLTVRASGHTRSHVMIPAGQQDLTVEVEMDRPIREAGIFLTIIGLLAVPTGVASAATGRQIETVMTLVPSLSVMVAGALMWIFDRHREPVATITQSAGPAIDDGGER